MADGMTQFFEPKRSSMIKPVWHGKNMMVECYWPPANEQPRFYLRRIQAESWLLPDDLEEVIMALAGLWKEWKDHEQGTSAQAVCGKMIRSGRNPLLCELKPNHEGEHWARSR